MAVDEALGQVFKTRFAMKHRKKQEKGKFDQLQTLTSHVLCKHKMVSELAQQTFYSRLLVDRLS